MLRPFFFLFLLCSLFSCTNKASKLAYVESDRLLIEFNETQKAGKELEKNTVELRARFDTLRSELEQLQTEFTQKLASYNEQERRVAEAALSRKQADADRYYKMMSEKIREEDEKATKELLKKIDKVVKTFGEKNNYDIIFGATNQGNIVYAKEAKNVTDEIIEILNH